MSPAIPLIRSGGNLYSGHNKGIKMKRFAFVFLFVSLTSCASPPVSHNATKTFLQTGNPKIDVVMVRGFQPDSTMLATTPLIVKGYSFFDNERALIEPQYHMNSTGATYAFKWMRTGESWLFGDEMTLLIGGARYVIKATSDPYRKVLGEHLVIEQATFSIPISLFEKILTTGKVDIRVSGKNTRDYRLTKPDMVYLQILRTKAVELDPNYKKR